LAGDAVKQAITYFAIFLALPVQLLAAENALSEAEALDQRIARALSGSSLETVEQIRELGDLQERKIGTYDVGHAEGEWHQLHFSAEGLDIDAIVHSRSPRHAMISEIRITESKWVLTDGARVGLSSEDLEWPVQDRGSYLEVCGLNNCIQFSTRSGRIAEIHISLYVD
jgi:hypothetical protein